MELGYDARFEIYEQNVGLPTVSYRFECHGGVWYELWAALGMDQGGDAKL